ncbi:hotdog fold thioesterase [Candidatus Bathyarchaeota archaeon]|nr:hotdog fold thioesterase [Candidatus Bathyarchaeota archaeon]
MKVFKQCGNLLFSMDSIALVKDQFEQDNFAKILGVVLDELTAKTVKMHLVLDPKMNNLFGRPHGGAIYGLADAAFSVIGNNDDNLSVALECSINYHSSPEPGSVLHVEGKLVASSRRIGTYLFNLYTLDAGEKKPIATMKSTLYRTGKKISDLE